MKRYKTIFTTERSERHQQAALDAAPDQLDIYMLREPDEETLQNHLQDAVYLISERRGTLDAALIRAAPELKLILRPGSMTYDIDLEAAGQAGISVCYWPDGFVIRVAEHIVMQMLALLKKQQENQQITLQTSPDWRESRRTDENTFAYNWSGRQHISGLQGKTIGISGFGEIGTELARRLHGWDCTLLYNKRTRFPAYVETALGITYVDKTMLYRHSDIIVNLLPYSPETALSIDRAVFKQMKAGVFIVHAGSGSVIDENALAEAIQSGQVAGAALDTYEYEPIKADNPLIELAKSGCNVLLTPHIAGGTHDGGQHHRADLYTNIIHHMQGKSLRYQVV